MRIRGAILIAAVALMLSPGMGANAADIEFNDQDAPSPDFCTLNRIECGGTRDYFGTTFSHTGIGAYEIDEAEFEYGNPGGGAVPPPDVEACIYEDGGALPGALLGCSDTLVLPAFGVPINLVVPFGTPVSNLIDGVTYWLLFQNVTPPVAGERIGAGRSFFGDTYPRGEAKNCFADLSSCGTFAGDLEFYLRGTEGAAATANEIVIPADLATITELPFAVSGTCDDSTQDTLAIFLRDSATDINIDSFFTSCLGDDTWDVGTMGSAAWNTDVIVTLFDVEEATFGKRILPSLDFHTVTIDVTSNTNIAPPVIDAGATDEDFGFLGNLIRDVFIFLIIPSPEALARFSNLFDLIASKPPIGFITAAVAAFGSLEVGSPVETLEGTATLSEYFDPIRAAISAFLFLLFGLWLINRLSRISI